jgi:succinate-semialdehyde dehydrogenase/glutarate-semialdehyde dehydrogenase
MSLLKQQAFVAGRWEDGEEGHTKDVVNPANGTVIGTIPHMGAK